jgi:hypothetical protein
MDTTILYKLTLGLFDMVKTTLCKLLLFLFAIELTTPNNKYLPFKWLKYILWLFPKTVLLEAYFSKPMHILIQCYNKIYYREKNGPLNGSGITVYGNVKEFGVNIIYYKDSQQVRLYLTSENFRSLKNNYVFSISEFYRNGILKDELCHAILNKNVKKFTQIFSDIVEDYTFDAEDREIIKTFYEKK